MNSPARRLPPPFADLEPWVEAWALPTERERYVRLHTSTLDTLRGFYNAMLPRMDAILDHLDQYSLNAMPEEARTLFELSMCFAETAHPVDLKWGDVDFNLAYPWDRLEFRSVSANPMFNLSNPQG